MPARVMSNIRLEYGWMPTDDELEDVDVVMPLLDVVLDPGVELPYANW